MTHDATTGNTYTVACPRGELASRRNAENRITGTAGYTYTYDADGNRVEKSNGSTGTLYWYMSPGIVAESDLSGNLQSEYVFFDGERVARKDFPSAAVSYYFSDHLGTASVITNSAGTITEDEDFYPWGGELPFVSNDSNHYKFTGKERDAETGLDNFGKRYYGSALGRFITPDPFMNSGHPADPQTWNRYTYVLNNPLRYTDPTGLYTWGNCSGSADQCKGYQQRFRDSLANLKKSASNLDPHSKEGKKLNGIIKRYGEEGKGGPSINFGDAGHDKNGNAYLGSTLGNKVTLNYEAVDNEVKSWGNALHYNGDQQKSFSDAVNAALTGHEGGHLAKFGLPGLSLMMHTERAALYSESATYQGLHFTDPMSDALWNESWANASDREQLRSKAIQNELDRQAGKDQPNK